MSEKKGTELSKLNRFSNGRRLFVLRKMHKLANELAMPELVTAAAWALTHERTTRKLERKWRQVREKRSRGRGKAQEIDIKLDRIIGAMFGALNNLLEPLDPASELAIKVRAFIDTYFPNGAEEITKAEFEDALAIIDEMNEDLAALTEEQLAELSILHHARGLAHFAPLFHAELDGPSDGFEFRTLLNARLEGHERLCELVGGVLFLTRDRDNPQNVEKRAALLAPVLDANERVSARRKRRNGPDVEVDPNTGEELLEDDVLVDEEDVDQDLDTTDPTENV